MSTYFAKIVQQGRCKVPRWCLYEVIEVPKMQLKRSPSGYKIDGNIKSKLIKKVRVIRDSTNKPAKFKTFSAAQGYCMQFFGCTPRKTYRRKKS